MIGQTSAILRTDRPPNAAPQNLADKNCAGGKGDIEDTKVGRTGLGNNDILRLEEVAQARPEPQMGDYLIVFLRQTFDERRDVDLLCDIMEVLKFF